MANIFFISSTCFKRTVVQKYYYMSVVKCLSSQIVFHKFFMHKKKREFFLFAISFHSTNRICPQPSCQNSRGVGTRWVGRTKGTGKLPSSQSVLNFIYLSTELLHLKEGCNTGHGLSAAIKLGSLQSGKNRWSFSYRTLV